MAGLSVATVVLDFLVFSESETQLKKLWCRHPHSEIGPFGEEFSPSPLTECGRKPFTATKADGTTATYDDQTVSDDLANILDAVRALALFGGIAGIAMFLLYLMKNISHPAARTPIFYFLLKLSSITTSAGEIALFGILISGCLRIANSPILTIDASADKMLFYGDLSKLHTLIIWAFALAIAQRGAALVFKIARYATDAVGLTDDIYPAHTRSKFSAMPHQIPYASKPSYSIRVMGNSGGL